MWRTVGHGDGGGGGDGAVLVLVDLSEASGFSGGRV